MRAPGAASGATDVPPVNTSTDPYRQPNEAAVEAQAGVGDLDDERGTRGMLATVVSPAPAGHGNVGLRLRLVIEGDRSLGPDQPLRAEGGAEGALDQPDRRVVGGPLGLAHDQVADDELDRLAGAEDADRDQALVLCSRPAACPRRRGGHGPTLQGGLPSVNVTNR